MMSAAASCCIISSGSRQKKESTITSLWMVNLQRQQVTHTKQINADKNGNGRLHEPHAADPSIFALGTMPGYAMICHATSTLLCKLNLKGTQPVVFGAVSMLSPAAQAWVRGSVPRRYKTCQVETEASQALVTGHYGQAQSFKDNWCGIDLMDCLSYQIFVAW